MNGKEAQRAPIAAQSVQGAQAKAILERRARSGANWFIWIAGLSLVNSVIAFSGSNTRFILGLGITQITDQLAGGSANPAAIVFDLLAAGIFLGFGLVARKFRSWAFIVGMIVYGLDSLIFVLAKEIFSIAFHLFALFSVYRGMKANEGLAKLQGTAGAPM